MIDLAIALCGSYSYSTMGATIRDVAQRAGVGLGTVSRVLNQSPLVSAATRQRVLDVIAELDYTPSPIARSLSLGKTLSVATIAPFMTRPSVVERLRGIEATLSSAGYHLIVFNVESPERRDACLREVPRSERADGMLVISLTPRANEVVTMQEGDMPVVLIDTYAPDMTSVAIDDVLGGLLATRHLIALGHRRMAYIGDSLDDPFNFTSSRYRYVGHRKALEEAGIHVQQEYYRCGKHTRYEACRLAQELLTTSMPPTAIFAASDTQAMGVLEAAHVTGIRVPDDLSVIGFDDIDVAEYLHLTTVRQQLFASGVRGAQLLLGLLDGSLIGPVNETLGLELVVRATTAPPP